MSDNQSQNNKRIAKNTILLYFRMIFLMLISLYTSRVVLNTLGVEDYGIYNVVGGIVAMFGMINGALGASVSRFLNIEMGRGDKERLRKVFSASVFIHIILACIVVVIAEIFGPWFIENKMNIPYGRLFAAQWVFHCSVLTLAMNMISIPYNGCIIANENMKVYAYVGIIEAILRLAIVYVLMVFEYDKLVLYGILMLAVAIFIRIIYQIYCRLHYEESKMDFHIDYSIIKDMFGFASWNMLGSSSVIFADQGVNILINVFCSPIANAARGLALQVNSAVNQFSTNFITAINPQITKSYGANELEQYKILMYKGSKFSVILLCILTLPFLLESEFILNLWLGQIPNHLVTFLRLVLCFSISEAFSCTFTTGLLATGKIKKLMILVAGMRLMNFPVSLFLLYYYRQPELTFVVSIVISQICLILRLYLLKEYIPLSIIHYYFAIVFRTVLIFLCSMLLGMFIVEYLNSSLARFIISSCTSEFIYILLVYIFLINKSERQYLLGLIITVKNKISK